MIVFLLSSYKSYIIFLLDTLRFRFLTPMPNESQNVNDVARQAGANPITLPSENKNPHQPLGGEISPTVVVDFPSNWAWTNDAPNWYSKGADVDELLNEAEALDWSDKGVTMLPEKLVDLLSRCSRLTRLK